MTPVAQCIAHLAGGGVVLTRDRRQARLLRRLHDQAQLQAGRTVWPSAQVLPLEAWVASQYREAAVGRQLPEPVDALASEWLWRDCLPAADLGLMDRAQLASAVRSSWLRLRAHQGDARSLQGRPLTRDQALFRDWAQAVELRLAQQGQCDAEDLLRQCCDLAIPVPAGADVLIAGFHLPTPVQRRFIGLLAQGGRNVTELSLRAQPAEVFRYCAADPDDELATALGWLRSEMMANPGGLYAMIIPDLAARRAVIERACAGVLQPSLELPGAAPVQCLYELAGGTALSSWPVVTAALSMLACGQWRIAFGDISLLLRSHYLDADRSSNARLQLELSLRAGPPPMFWPRDALLRILRASAAEEFSATFNRCGEILAESGQRLPSQWAMAFGQVLAAWGWPVQSGIGSAEFQAAQAFRDRLQSLARLDAVVGTISQASALAELRRSAAQSYQPERGEPSIYLLDALDSPGPWFDGLWVSGQTAAAWPRPVRGDPFLPIDLQRRLAMPGAAAEDSVDEAAAVSARWRQDCQRLVLSWPRREHDTDVLGSTLLPADLVDLPRQPTMQSREQLWLGAGELQQVADDPAPALAHGDSRGGARILELQARCPFRAFAELRLKATALAEPAAGIDPRLRGSIAHRALELFWQETKDSTSLQALAPTLRQARVADCVRQAMAGTLLADCGERTRALEAEWQQAALQGLVEADCERAPFSVIGRELPLAGQCGGLSFSLRVDRVDEVNGQAVIIDYKTGKPKRSHWANARLEAPQLPLYAMLYPQTVAAIAFARLQPQESSYISVGAEAGLLPGLQLAGKFSLSKEQGAGHDWDEITRQWAGWLAALATAYRSGDARVDPKQPQSCRGCHLGALCRVGDFDEDEHDDDAEADEDNDT